MRAIDGDALKRRAQKAATKAWKMKIEAKVETILNQFIDWINEAPTIQPEPHWIPVTERLPEEPFGCLVTVMDTNPMTMEEFENILPYFVGWDGEQWNDADGEQCPFEVLAYMPLPEPYKGVTE